MGYIPSRTPDDGQEFGGLMNSIQVEGQVGRAELEAFEVLVLLLCEGTTTLNHETAALDGQLR